MKIVIPGGSGQVGTILAQAFHAAGDEVVVLSRSPEARPWQVVVWDGVTPGAWHREIEGCHAYPDWPDAARDLCARSRSARVSKAGGPADARD